MINNKIIVAIDTPEEERLSELLNDLNTDLCMIKIGSILFNSLGRRSFDLVANKGCNIFFDIKFQDIPNTVAHSILSFKGYPINLLTVHISGGMSMLTRAREAAHAIKSKVIGVSLLTSLDQKDVEKVFFNDKFSIADITAWRMIQWFCSGKLEHVDQNFIKKFPLLESFYDKMNKNNSFIILNEYKEIIS